jgi:hypothetical protein
MGIWALMSEIRLDIQLQQLDWCLEKKYLTMFGLEHVQGQANYWVDSSSGAKVFEYEIWCDEPEPRDRYQKRETWSDGWRLWVRIDKLNNFCPKWKWSLFMK